MATRVVAIVEHPSQDEGPDRRVGRAAKPGESAQRLL
jgi:hypothetical protein